MTRFISSLLSVSFCVAAALSGAPALAQHEAHETKPAAAAPHEKRVGDPYPLAVCPVSGKRLGAMGDAVVKVYHGREVRFCCDKCPAKFEADMKAGMASLDEKIAKDQAPLYPLHTSVVSGKALPEKPVQFVYANRLFLLADDSERAAFEHHAKDYFAALDKAVIETQGRAYPIKTCPVSGDEFGGEMGEPVDLVVAGRLVRLCCKGCKKDVNKDPAKFIEMVDAARKGAPADPQAGGHGDHDHK
ncbi:MAG: hypothetical protein IT437_13850 [Phycisphaerales bacterium]|nr:hypothetical protein [Phycisphaerales bacterium]